MGFPNSYPLDSIYLVDSAIQHLNKRGQKSKKNDNKLPLAVKSSFSYSVELTFP